MANTGKTGADALWRALHKALTVMNAYAPKFRAVVAIMVANGHLAAPEAATIIAFLDGLSALDAALKKVSDYSGIS